jgi:hypothetical protein
MRTALYPLFSLSLLLLKESHNYPPLHATAAVVSDNSRVALVMAVSKVVKINQFKMTRDLHTTCATSAHPSCQ